MKKVFSALAFLLAVMLLCLPGLAENETLPETPAQTQTQTQPKTEPATEPKTETQTPPETEEKPTGEFAVRSVSITAKLPLAGETWSEVKVENIKIAAVVNGEAKTLSAPLDFDMNSSLWYDNASGTEKELKANELFINGRSYVLKIRFSLFVKYLAIDGDTVLTVNGKKAQLSRKGDEYEVKGTFVCTPRNLAPTVSLEVKGSKTKEYDGKETTLTAKVEKTGGVGYRFEWYCDGVLLENRTESTLTLKNVSDSGKYHCKVYAVPTGNPTAEGDATESTAQEIKITPRTVTVQIEDAQKNLFDPDPKFSYTVMGEIFDELTGEPERKAGEDIGTYEIGAGTVAFDEDVKENYVLQILPGKLTVLNVDELPFSAVSSLADLSYVTGAAGSKIRVSASKGAIPAGAILKLSTATDEAKQKLSSLSGKQMMKSFSVSILDQDGKEIPLPKHASLKIQIPLTEKEADCKSGTVTVGLYSGSAAGALKADTVTNGEITYVAVQITETGTIALFEGEKVIASKPNVTDPAQKKEPPKKEGNVFLWVFAVLLTATALGAIVFTLIWSQKNKSLSAKRRKPTAQKPKGTPPVQDPAAAAEKERIRRIADEINAMPPVPEAAPQKPKSEAGEQAAAPIPPKKTVSFEDLED